MTFLKTVAVAFSAYSALPMPQFTWEEDGMGYAICAFPLVGAVCGGALILWQLLSQWLGVSGVLFAAVAVCLPLLLTGGIHMDGFMDTVDALASHQSRERQLEIMKDSACGAFAVIYCGMYLLLSFALFYELDAMSMAGAPLIYVCSRCLSGLWAVTLPNARRAGMLYSFTQYAQKRRAVLLLALLLAAAAAALLVLSPLSLLLGLLTALGFRFWVLRRFGGITGDLSGFFLQLCELAMLAGLYLGGLL